MCFAETKCRCLRSASNSIDAPVSLSVSVWLSMPMYFRGVALTEIKLERQTSLTRSEEHKVEIEQESVKLNKVVGNTQGPASSVLLCTNGFLCR